MGITHNLQDITLNFLKKKASIIEGNGILIALSGGVDSMVLFDCLLKNSKETQFNICAAYIDHGIRYESKSERDFLKSYCQKFNVPFFTKEIVEPKDSKTSPEEWLRNKRYAFLQSLVEENDLNYIATGHHADDQAETILFRMSQGAGIEGLAGIKPINGIILRPLYKISKNEIIEYANKNNIPFFKDHTNENIEIPRNFIRHNILTTWKAEYPEIINGISSSAENLTESIQALDFWLDEILQKVDYNNETTFVLNREWYDKLPVYIRVKVLFKLLDLSDPFRKYTWNELKEFLSSSKTGKTMNLPENWTLANGRNNWIVSQNFYSENVSIKVNSGTAIICGDYVFTAKRVKQSSKLVSSPLVELVDADKVDLNSMVLRTWQPGDSFIPLGMNGNKKVSDFLIDEKISLWQKERQTVLTSKDEIIWVCGLRISDNVKITEKTVNYLKLIMEKRK